MCRQNHSSLLGTPCWLMTLMVPNHLLKESTRRETPWTSLISRVRRESPDMREPRRVKKATITYTIPMSPRKAGRPSGRLIHSSRLMPSGTVHWATLAENPMKRANWMRGMEGSRAQNQPLCRNQELGSGISIQRTLKVRKVTHVDWERSPGWTDGRCAPITKMTTLRAVSRTLSSEDSTAIVSLTHSTPVISTQEAPKTSILQMTPTAWKIAPCPRPISVKPPNSASKLSKIKMLRVLQPGLRQLNQMVHRKDHKLMASNIKTLNKVKSHPGPKLRKLVPMYPWLRQKAKSSSNKLVSSKINSESQQRHLNYQARLP